MGKRFIITEEEKNDIKSLYNINEQEVEIDDDNFLMKAFEKYMFPDSGSTENSSGDSYLNDTSSGSVDSKWMNVTKKVIDNFEGGYWNPKCGHTTKGMGKSTETMFGLDRYNGNIESTPEGKEFFRIIDNEKTKPEFCKTWKHYYRGGHLEETLKNLAAKIMKHQYDNNSQNYFSPELKKRVEANDRLLMHFSYASWNGPGYFKKFAKSLDDGIKSGKSDSELINQAISDRKSSVLYNQDKVASVMKSSDLNLS
jgi:hypothetical protein